MTCPKCLWTVDETFCCLCTTSPFEVDQNRAYFQSLRDRSDYPSFWSRIKRLKTIPIQVHRSLALLILLISIGFLFGDPSLSKILTLFAELSIIYASLLLHEFSHVYAAHRFGLNIKRVVVHFFGAAAELTSNPPSPKAEFWIAIAGPACNFALASAFLIVHAICLLTIGISSHFFLFGIAANVVMGVFNLLPIYPMDGGRILRAIHWNSYEKLNHPEGPARAFLKAAEDSIRISKFISFLAIFLLLMNGWFIAALAIFFISNTSSNELAFLKDHYTKKYR